MVNIFELIGKIYSKIIEYIKFGVIDKEREIYKH